MSPQHLVIIRHNFETAHRIPPLPGKCQNLHGHSWWAEIAIVGPKGSDGTVMEFGQLKADVRHWIDGHLDHGAILGAADPLADVLDQHGSKVYRLTGRGALEQDLHWPTVENVAVLLGRVATVLIEPHPGATVHRVTVIETHVNAAEYRP